MALAVTGLASVSTAAAADTDTKAPLLQRTDEVITADPLPTVQIDSGYVWAQTVIGSTVYSAGSFSNARAALAAPGTQLTPRSNILAFDIETGGLLPFAPTVNGVIKAVAASPDGARLYIGGSFTSVNGQSRWGFAALDAASGELVPGFSPAIGGSGVYAITATADTVYVGGLFTQANGVARKNLAAFAASDGALRPWESRTDHQVDALVIEPGTGRVIAGGRFSTVDGVIQRGLVALDPATGARDTGWLAPKTVGNGSASGDGGIFALAVDDGAVYGTGWRWRSGLDEGNLEGAFAAEAGSGAIRWIADCHGDNYGVYSTGQTVYTTSHMHSCETVNLQPQGAGFRYLAAFTATAEGILGTPSQTGSAYKDWTGSPSPSAYAVYPDFSVGTATGMGQAGLSITGAGDYIVVGGEFTSVNNKQFQGIVRFSTAPAGGAKQGPRLGADAWAAPTSVTATGPGRVRIRIPANWDRDDRDLTYVLVRDGIDTDVSTTVSSTWWKQGEVVLDDSGLVGGSTHQYAVRAVDADGNSVLSRTVTATATAGTSYPYADQVMRDRPAIYYPLGSETKDWAGDNIPVFGSANSAVTDSAVGPGSTGATSLNGTANGWVANNGSMAAPMSFSAELWFKTSTTTGGRLLGFGASKTTSTGSNDRHVYMTNDGRLVFGVYKDAPRTVATTTSYNDGEWHHVVASFGSMGIALYVDGELTGSDPAITSAVAYTGFWRLGGYTIGAAWPNKPTTDFIAATVDEFAVYSAPLSAERIKAHFTAGSHRVAPTPAFSSAVSELTATMDASGSTAGPGAGIVSYSWDFGDGSAPSTGASLSHTYAAAGTYAVTLTVTDDQGLSATSTQEITIPGVPTTIAEDDFSRDVVSGWGTAETGGQWTVTAGAASAASVSGGQGRLNLSASATRNVLVDAGAPTDLAMSVDFSVDQAPSTGTTYVGLVARSSSSGQYLVRSWLKPDGTVWLVLQRDSTVLSTTKVTGLTRDAGDTYTLKAEIAGAGTTTITAKVWPAGDAEPEEWQASIVDASGLPGGAVGVHASRGSTSTTAAAIAFDGFHAIRIG